MDKFEKYRNCFKKEHLVYVYIIEEFRSCYVGRTKDMHSRDLSHRRGKKHHDGQITFDALYSFCKQHGISIPLPLILEEGLSGPDSLLREDFYVRKYKEYGWNVLNKAKTGLNSGSLGHVQFWTYETCKEACKSFGSISELKKSAFGCYEVCLENGWLDEFIPFFLKKKNGYWNIKENVLAAANDCKTITEFINKYYGAYVSSKKNGWVNDLPFKKEEKIISPEEIWNYYKECKNLKETMKKISYVL